MINDDFQSVPNLDGSLKKAAARLANRLRKDRPLEKNPRKRSLLSNLTPYEIAQSIQPQSISRTSGIMACFKVMTFSGGAYSSAYMSIYGRSVICAIYMGTNCYVLAGQKASKMRIYENGIDIAEIRGSHKSMQIDSGKNLIAEIKRTFKLGLFNKSIINITSGPSVILADGTRYEKLFPEPNALKDVDPDIVRILLITAIWRTIYRISG